MTTPLGDTPSSPDEPQPEDIFLLAPSSWQTRDGSPGEPTQAEVLDVLVRARARIASIRNWTVGAAARMGLIPIVFPCNPNARAWSADGAVRAESGGSWTPLGNEAFRWLAAAAGVPALDMPAWNDRVEVDADGHADYTARHSLVLEAFDRAITTLSRPVSGFARSGAPR